MKKRVLSILLVLAMVLTLLPTVAFAEVAEGSKWQIGEDEGATGYTSLSEAIEAASETEPTTIKAIGKNLSIEEDYSTVTKNITIDTADQTVYFNEGAKLSNSMNVTSSGGNLNVNWGALIGGNVTVTGGNLMLNQNTVSGTITISGTINKLQAQYNNIVVADEGVTITSTANSQHNVHNLTGGAVTLTGAMPLTVWGALGSNVSVNAGATLRLDKNATVTGTVTQPETGVNAIISSSSDSSYVNADSLAGIISAVSSNETIKLLSDATVSSNIQDNSSKTYTLDLNGHTVTFNNAYYYMYGSVKVTIKDGSEEKTGAISHTGGSYPLYVNGSAKLTIESGTFHENVNSSNTSLIYTGSSTAKVDIKGGTFNVKGSSKFVYENGGGTVDISGGTLNTIDPSTASEIFGCKSSSKITISGGTFNTGNRQFVETNQTVSVQGGLYDQDVSLYCAGGLVCALDPEHEGYYKTVPLGADNAALQRKHGDEYFFSNSIKTCMAEAQDNDVITFLKDVTYTNTIYTDAKNVTLDLSGHTLTKNDWVNGEIDLYEDMTIKNGTVLCETSGASSAICVFNERDIHLTLENVTIKSTGSNIPIAIYSNQSGKAVKLTITAVGNNTVEYVGEYDHPAIIMGSEEMDSTRDGNNHLVIDGTGFLTLKAPYGIAVILNCGTTGQYPYTNTITVNNPNFVVRPTRNEVELSNGEKWVTYNSSIYGYFVPGIQTVKTAPSVALNISAGKFHGDFDEIYGASVMGKTYTPAAGESLYDGSVLSGGQYSFKPAARYIADGYEAVRYSNGAYPDLKWEIVKIKQVDAGTAKVEGEQIKIETHGSNAPTVIEVKEKGTGVAVATTDVAEIITAALDNDNVSEFEGTKVETNTDTTGIKEELKNVDSVKDDAVAKENIENATNILRQITVDLTATSVETVTAQTTTKVINSMTFEVKPIARTTVLNENGNEETVEVIIPNELIKEPLTFRLFVDQNVTATEAAVYHGDGKDYIGIFPIQTAEDGKKFIELSAKEFSLYTYETITGIDENAVAMVTDGAGTYTGFATLAAAIEAAANGNTIILLKNVGETTDTIDFKSTDTKAYDIDLNGHVLTGTADEDSAKYVTISNNDAENPECLAVLGVFANDVSAFVVDGYATVDYVTTDTANDNRKVVDNTANNEYVVKVVTKAYDEDRDTTNDTEVKNVDLFAGDIVTAEVRVYGTHFVGAKVTFTYDKGNFTDVTEDVYGEYSDGWDYNEDTNIWEFKNAYDQPNKYYETEYDETENASYYVLGEFAFEVKAIDEATIETGKTGVDGNGNPVMKVPFKVKAEASETYPKTYIAGAWKNGWDTNPANEITEERLFNDFANIRLKQMTASVTPETEGLVYKATGLKLLEEGYSAKDTVTQEAITDAVITYALGTGDDGTTPPEASAYTATQPMPSDAGTYVVFYKIAKDGYVTVAGSEEVTIEKRPVTLTWTAADFIKGQKDADHPSDFWGSYVTGKTFNKPVVKYEDANGATQTLDASKVTMITAPSGATALNKTGNYVFKAVIDDNYAINNDECAILIDGGTIVGYTLEKTDETTETTTGSEIWRDGTAHAAAKMTEVDSTEEDQKTQGVNITYYLSSDNGKTFSETGTTTMPEVSAVGKYVVKAVLSKEGYYTQEQFHQITIKSVEYYTEKTDYVVGWDMVLVYTNESVPAFTYDGHAMYDVSTLGYKYGTQYDVDGKVVFGQEGTAYTHVYAILVYGVGDTSKVVPSNKAENTKTIYPEKEDTIAHERNDVNESGAPDLNDLVAVQAVYNVDTKNYLNDDQMHIALKCDVTGNKMVDMSDYAQIKTKF